MSGRPKTILVVDDEEAIRYVFSELLGADGYEVHVAAQSSSALTILETLYVDLVISDMIMPGLSGSELLAEIRVRHPRTRVILLTGQPDEHVAKQALDLGAFAFLTKPIRATDLRKVVERALRHSP